MSTITAILQVALSLLLVVQNNPSLPDEQKQQAIQVATQAIQLATQSSSASAAATPISSSSPVASAPTAPSDIPSDCHFFIAPTCDSGLKLVFKPGTCDFNCLTSAASTSASATTDTGTAVSTGGTYYYPPSSTGTTANTSGTTAPAATGAASVSTSSSQQTFAEYCFYYPYPGDSVCQSHPGAAGCSCPLPSPRDGRCGEAESRNYTHGAPAESLLCTYGTASPVSTVNNGGMYTWTCSGSSGKTVSCEALNYIPPGCTSGEGISTTTGLDCSGKSPDAVSGVCGPANGGSFASLNSASPDLCSVGTVYSFGHSSSQWYWGCASPHGGDGVGQSCLANISVGSTAATPTTTPAPTGSASGVCGPANGSSFLSLSSDSSGLCSVGTVYSFGHTASQWSWGCAGGSGVSQTCLANISVPTAPTSTMASSGPQPTNLDYCWYYPYPGDSVCQSHPGAAGCSCPLPSPRDGRCGEAESRNYTHGAPAESLLCTYGTASPVSTVNNGGMYTWTCSGSSGKTVSCEALNYIPPGCTSGEGISTTTGLDCSGKSPDAVSGVCGPANGGSFASLNSASPDLCSVGTVYSFGHSSSQWYWGCASPHGGDGVGQSCFAAVSESSTGSTGLSMTSNISSNAPVVSSPAPVNGSCGIASGGSFTTLSSGNQNLCYNGTLVMNFSGSGPWTWGCGGLHGGTDTASNACGASLRSNPNDAPCSRNSDCNACTGGLCFTYGTDSMSHSPGKFCSYVPYCQ